MPDRTHSKDFETRDRITSRPHVWLMIGLPRSGKSTWANAHRRTLDTTIVGSDDIRRAMGTEFDVKLEGRVWGAFNLMVKALVARGQNIIVDNPNHTVASRKLFVAMAQEGTIDLTYVVLPELPEAEHRLRCEKWQFPWEVVAEQKARWQPLTADELLVGRVVRV